MTNDSSVATQQQMTPKDIEASLTMLNVKDVSSYDHGTIEMYRELKDEVIPMDMIQETMRSDVTTPGPEHGESTGDD